MFCPNCGNQMEDYAKFCAVCGAALSEEQEASTPAPRPSARKAGLKMAAVQNKGMAIKMGAAMLVLVVLIAAAAMVFRNNYRKPLDDTIKLLNAQEYSIEKYLHAMAPKWLDDATKDMLDLLKDVDEYSDEEDEAEESMMDRFHSLMDLYGEHLKFSYEILDTRELKKTELNNIRNTYKAMRDDLEEMKEGGSAYYFIENALTSSKLKKYDRVVEKLDDSLKNMKVTKGYEVELNLIVEGKKYKNSYCITVDVVKVDGKWCFNLMDLDNWMSRMW